MAWHSNFKKIGLINITLIRGRTSCNALMWLRIVTQPDGVAATLYTWAWQKLRSNIGKVTGYLNRGLRVYFQRFLVTASFQIFIHYRLPISFNAI